MPLTGPEKTAARNALKASTPGLQDAKIDRMEARWPAEWLDPKSVKRWITGKK